MKTRGIPATVDKSPRERRTPMLRNLMLAAGAIVLGATTAGASPSAIFEGEVPVPFVVNGVTFPAGRYMVERESSSILLIRGEKKNHSAAFISTLRDAGLDPAGAEPALVLKEVEGKYRLTGVWGSSGEGWDIVREYR
jgi:hypothetical protein